MSVVVTHEGQRFTVSNSLVVIECYKCHCLFAMSDDLNRRALEEKLTFYCPLGHSQSYVTSELDKAKKKQRELEQKIEREQTEATFARNQLRRERENHKGTQRSLAATKGVVTRQRNRAQKGMCPVAGCRRHFSNVYDHVHTEHPQWAQEHPEVFAEAAANGDTSKE